MFITEPQFGHTLVSGPPAGCFPHFGQDIASSGIPLPQCIQYLFAGGGGGGGGFFLNRKKAIAANTAIKIIAIITIVVVSIPPDGIVDVIGVEVAVEVVVVGVVEVVVVGGEVVVIGVVVGDV